MKIILGFLISSGAIATGTEFEIELDLITDRLTCTKNMASAQNVYSADLRKLIRDHRLLHDHKFSRTFLYPEGAYPADCDLAEELSDRVVQATIRAQDYETIMSRCERGSVWYCREYACYRFKNEYAVLSFNNGLELKSKAYEQSGERLYTGRCR